MINNRSACASGYSSRMFNRTNLIIFLIFSLGKYAALQVFDDSQHSFTLKTPSSFINSFGKQILSFYYFISNVGPIQIRIRLKEADGKEEIINSISSDRIQGWIRSQVNFNVVQSGYQVMRTYSVLQ